MTTSKNETLNQVDENNPVEAIDAMIAMVKQLENTITEWDSEKAAAEYQEYLSKLDQYDGKLIAASKAYFNDHLSGKVVKTKIGLVRINSKSKGKVHDRMRDVKYLAIPYIPEVLMTGDVGDLVPLNKEREDSAVGYYHFTKGIKFKYFTLNITLKVALDADGNLLYFLGAAKEKANLRSISHAQGTIDSKAGFDSIESHEYDEINLIVQILDKNGHVLTDDEAEKLLLGNVDITHSAILKGRSNNVKTAKGTKLETIFAVVEADQLIASHTATGAENPAYPQELQPRDRSRDSSQAWVQKTANNLDPESLGRTGRADTGAPIVGDDLVVESGNGRTMAIQLAYDRGNADEYKQWLMDEAQYFGFKPDQIETMNQPVLVRIRKTPIDRAAFAVEANQDDKLSFTATERAKADAKRIDGNLSQLFNPSEDGDLLAASNQKFIQGFLKSLGETESAQYLTTEGKPTQALVARIKAAVFSKAYNDDRLLEMVADQTKPDLQNMLNALSVAAPKFIEAQSVSRANAEDLSSQIVDGMEKAIDERVVNAIIDAANVVMNAKHDNQDVAEFVKQQGLFGDLPEGVPELAIFLAKNSRSAKKMSLLFKAMAEYLELMAIDQSNMGLFGDPEPIKMQDVISYANKALEQQYGDGAVNLGVFDAAIFDSIIQGSGVWSVTAKKPELNSDPQELYQVVRDDGVLLCELMYFEDAEYICKLLNEKSELQEILNTMDMINIQSCLQRLKERRQPLEAAYDSWLSDGHYEHVPVDNIKIHKIADRSRERAPTKQTPILLQEKNHTLWLIAGKKRLELALSDNEEMVPAIILNEKEGCTDEVLKLAMHEYKGSIDPIVLAADIEDKVTQQALHDIAFDSAGSADFNLIDVESDPVTAIEVCILMLQQKIEFSAENTLSAVQLIEHHDNFMDKAKQRKVTPEDWKIAFNQFNQNIDNISEYFKKLKIAELLNLGGSYFGYRYKGEKKERIIKALLDQYLSDYALSNTIRVAWGEKYNDVIKGMVERGDQQQLDQYAKDYAEAVAADDAKIEAIADPKTLDDFKSYFNTQQNQLGKTFKEAYFALAPEQRAAYDEFAAFHVKTQQTEKDQKEPATYRGTTTVVTIHSTKHTKYGHDIWTVVLGQRLEKDNYNTANTNAKKLGGYYSSYNGGGAIRGFVFKTEESAKAFAAMMGGDNTAAQDVANQRRNSFEDDRTQSTVERLREMADSIDTRANATLNADRKVNTARRVRMANAIEERARSEVAFAKTMSQIANGIESGQVKFLDKVRAKTQIDLLNQLLSAAQYHESQKHPEKRTLNDGSGSLQVPLTPDSASYAEYPYYTLMQSDWAAIGRQLIDIDGGKGIGARLLKTADDVSKEYLAFLKKNYLSVTVTKTDGNAAIFDAGKDAVEQAIKRSSKKGTLIPYQIKRGQYAIVLAPQAAKERGLWEGTDKKMSFNNDFGNEIIDAIRKYGIKVGMTLPWQLESAQNKQKALTRLGITTPTFLRAAMREYISLKHEPEAQDEIKALERSMVGGAKDGLDFFPTPENIVNEMIDVAKLKAGMSVLEPSAGMGHIADLVRSHDVEPDVIEYSGTRRELLEKKGFRVVGSDFMDFNANTEIDGEPVGLYDRIIMNPPFSDRRDAMHVQHAYNLLKPGGRLVSIMGEGVFFGQDSKAKGFRDWLEQVAGTNEIMAEGSFNDATLPVNTGANTRLVVIDK